ncbi:MAG: DUF362 domain-containing protein [Spirochaetota bacterium]
MAEKSKVYFIQVEEKEDPSRTAKKLKYLYDRCGAKGFFAKNDFVAVKTHFGDTDNTTYINPVLVKSVINKLKSEGAAVFLTETSTLYRGKRANAIDHITLAYEHGFGFDSMKVPLVMADGLLGDAEVPVEINGRHFKRVNVAMEAAKIQGVMALSHFKGHVATGFGGALKNIGMGLCSRKGKLQQHSVMSPEINRSKCTGCEMCIIWCPQDTIFLKEGKAQINKANCIGCGECLAVCQFGAVKFDFKRESRELQEMMAEHAAGVIKAVKGKVFYFNFLLNITIDCDCMNGGRLISPDIGIVAGKDIVAVERASYDLFKRKNGESFEKASRPNLNSLVQVEHAQAIGLGSAEYQLEEISW